MESVDPNRRETKLGRLTPYLLTLIVIRHRTVSIGGQPLRHQHSPWKSALLPSFLDLLCSPGNLVRSGQVMSGQVRSGRVGSGHVGSGQVRSGQVRSGQVRSYPKPLGHWVTEISFSTSSYPLPLSCRSHSFAHSFTSPLIVFLKQMHASVN